MHVCIALGVSLLALLPSSTPNALQVTGVFPARHEVSAATATPIAITFAEAIVPATVTSASVHVYGRWSGVMDGSLALTNSGRTIEFTAARPFFAGEAVTVMLADAVTGVSGARLEGGHTWSFWTRPIAGSRVFNLAATIPLRLPGETFLQTYGAYAGDLDRDGSPDFSLPCEVSADIRVLRNDGCGNLGALVRHPLQPVGAPSSNEGQDFNGDGYIDLAVGDIANGSIVILMGDGAGGYLAPVSYPSGRGTRGVAVLDAEGDGDVDIVTANRVASNLGLHINNGDGTFAPVALFQGGGFSETALATTDANNDGIADLFVGNFVSRSIVLMLGDIDGGFSTTAIQPITGQPWQIAAGDIDGDGAVDAVTCNWSSPVMSIARGDGQGGFLPLVEYATRASPLAIDLGDLDGDGALDIVVSVFAAPGYEVFFNDGSGNFPSSFLIPAPRAGSCAILCDEDRDGDLDIVGVDELSDVLLINHQVDHDPIGVQLATCAATLRIDARAGYGGFNGHLAHDVTAGNRFFVNIAGNPGCLWGVLAGIALAPGPDVGYGLLNLWPNGLVSLMGGLTDPFGESTFTILLPPTMPLGAQFAFQGGVQDATHPLQLRLTNTESIVVN